MPLFVGASESYDTDAWEAYNLKKENAKLRDELDAAKHDLSLFSERIVELGAENAKLRELVVRMFHTIEWNDRMSDSMYWPSSSYKQELRKLGIEVPK